MISERRRALRRRKRRTTGKGLSRRIGRGKCEDALRSVRGMRGLIARLPTACAVGYDLPPFGLTDDRKRSSVLLDVAVGEGQEGRPVGCVGVSTTMLAEGHVAVHQRSLDGGELGGPEVLLAQELVYRARAGGGHEHSLGIHPSITVGGAAADEDWARGTHRHQFVSVDG